tara:strand:+ start:609 stop:854 length:246 start_codon:yes stop_codon:yes gene_type:complete
MKLRSYKIKNKPVVIKNPKINISKYSNCELCLIVSNIEKYYNIAYKTKSIKKTIKALDQKYIYNMNQLKELVSWLEGFLNK